MKDELSKLVGRRVRIPAGTPSDPRSAAIVSQIIENVGASKVQMSSAGEVPPVYVAKPSDPFYSVTVDSKSTRFRVNMSATC